MYIVRTQWIISDSEIIKNKTKYIVTYNYNVFFYAHYRMVINVVRKKYKTKYNYNNI